MNALIVKEHFIEDSNKIIGNKDILQIREWKIIKSEFPELIISMVHAVSKKEYLFKFLCDDYPISVFVVEPETFEMAPYEKWPQGGLFLNQNAETLKPFICVANIRDYYKHHKEVQYMYNSNARLKVIVDLTYSVLQQANQ